MKMSIGFFCVVIIGILTIFMNVSMPIEWKELGAKKMVRWRLNKV